MTHTHTLGNPNILKCGLKKYIYTNVYMCVYIYIHFAKNIHCFQNFIRKAFQSNMERINFLKIKKMIIIVQLTSNLTLHFKMNSRWI